MKESDYIKRRAEAELKAEPLVRIFRQSLIEMYMQGYTDALDDTYNEKAAEKRLVEETDALAEQANAINMPDEEPIVRLKPDAILKRKLRYLEDFTTRTANVLKAHDINTLGDLVAYSEADLLSFMYFGKTCLEEVKRFVSKFGLELREG